MYLKYVLGLLLLVSCSTKQKETPVVAEEKQVEVVQTTPVVHDELSIEVTEYRGNGQEKHVDGKAVRPLPNNTPRVKAYCDKIQRSFAHYGWGLSQCQNFPWIHVRDSVLGDPLMWTVFGDEKEHRKSKKDLTLIMCGVHGDEITPIKFCFDVIHFLEEKWNSTEPADQIFKEKMVVVVPIVAPDSFFGARPSRTNANGVDVNRNLPTKDWDRKALSTWINRYRRDPRRNPGPSAMSEPETLFQVNLIKRYSPTKIISVHAPLTILDYDGPEDDGSGQGAGSKARDLLIQMSEHAKGYKIKNYPFFPGSLGNYAGNERKIPTYTLELPSSDNRNHKKYWNLFKGAIDEAITRDLRDDNPLD